MLQQPSRIRNGISSHGINLAEFRKGHSVLACSWPAYLGDNETSKPFQAMIDGGCNLWRNWADIDNSWKSVQSIIDHWGDYCESLKPFAGPGHWHDMDMVLVGDDHNNFTMNEDQSQTQLTIWSIMAAPLIMSSDYVRDVHLTRPSNTASLTSSRILLIKRPTLKHQRSNTGTMEDRS